MAKRFFDTELVCKTWFRGLHANEKVFFLYLLSKCDLAGIWEIDFEAAKFFCGTFNEKTILGTFKNHLVVLDCKKRVWLKDFVSFQSGDELKEKSPVHAKIISILKKHNYNKNTLYHTLSNRLLNSQEEIEVVIEEEKEEGEEIEVTHKKIPFDLFWNTYDKKVGERKKIEKKWDSLSLIEQQMIMTYIPNYIISQPDKQYRKNPETFLNNKSWNDELIYKSNGEQQSIGTKAGQEHPLAALDKLANGVLSGLTDQNG